MEKQRMIQHIIFDMGNVMIRWDPWGIAARSGLTGEDLALLTREVFAGWEWVSMDRGSLSQDEGLARICRRLPPRMHAAAAQCVRDWWKAPLEPVPGMAALARELKALGYGVYLLSNATSFVHDYFQRIPGWEAFDGKIISADWGLLKPERAIYDKLFDSFSLRPEDCFFIDDSPLNIDGAREAGMPGTVFFGDVARLRRELREAGVPVNEA